MLCRPDVDLSRQIALTRTCTRINKDMYRLKPIRTAPRQRPERALLDGANTAFWTLFSLSLVLCGGQAIDGIPSFLAAILPPGVFAAQASAAPPSEVVRLTVLLDQFAPSTFSPQVLYPIAGRRFPDWLVDQTAHGVPANGEPEAMPPGPMAEVAIVIDDLGPDIARSERSLALPKSVTLSFLPYAEATSRLAAAAERDGHEVLVHMPMQALGTEDPGPMALRMGLSPDEIRSRLVAALARVPGAMGINNHMGSALTADQNSLMPVAEELAARHLIFFDSRTTPNSQVVRVAHAFGVASAERDVFLDDEQTGSTVNAQLTVLEVEARQRGVAIAIGHPHDVTLASVAAWSSGAAARGYGLVSLSEAIRLKTERDFRRSLAAAGH